MIQRIQTLYWILTVILTALVFLFPFASIYDGTSTFEQFAYGIVENGEETLAIYWPTLIVAIAALLLPLVTIFFYKKRFFQWRMCLVEVILQLGLLGLMWFISSRSTKGLSEEIILRYDWSLVLPAICVILSVMAMRGVMKDMQKIRSLDRLR